MNKMKKPLSYFLSVVLLVGFVGSCAKKGSPTGGPVDKTPPAFTTASPNNFSTHFSASEVRLYFDEYIQLKDAQRQILISPPMETKAVITPMGTARKYIEIEFKDTLQKNTTYTVNFGQSITDFNEGNPIPFFKYVFSTGSYIDSLKLSGRLKDALSIYPDAFISVMLYKADSTYTDSIVYNGVPTYIAYSKDSTHTFQIENIKEGAYRLVAIKDKNRNYKFDPKQDKIAYYDQTIQIPTDTSYTLTLFNEILAFKAERPKHASKQHVLFGYQGKLDSFQIDLLSAHPADYSYRVIKDQEKDTLHYFYKPLIEKDSLVFSFTNHGGKYRDSLVVFLREQKMDSLKLKAQPSRSLDFGETFTLSANTPIVQQDTSRIVIRDKDSLHVSFTTDLHPLKNQLEIHFEQQENQLYEITLLPGAITDFFAMENDTLRYQLRTKEHTDYGVLTLKIQNLHQFPVIVQMINHEGKIVRERYSTSETRFTFKDLNPGEYFFRILFDDNANGQWDTGNYLRNIQPEKVTYFPDTLKVRANWDVIESFLLAPENP